MTKPLVKPLVRWKLCQLRFEPEESGMISPKLLVWCPLDSNEEDAHEYQDTGSIFDATDAAERCAERRWAENDCPRFTIVHVRLPDGTLERFRVEAEQSTLFRAQGPLREDVP